MIELTTEIDHHLLLMRVAPLDIRTQLTHLSSKRALLALELSPTTDRNGRWRASPQNSKAGFAANEKTTKSKSTRLLQFRVQLVDGVEDLRRIGGEQRQTTW